MSFWLLSFLLRLIHLRQARPSARWAGMPRNGVCGEWIAGPKCAGRRLDSSSNGASYSFQTSQIAGDGPNPVTRESLRVQSPWVFPSGNPRKVNGLFHCPLNRSIHSCGRARPAVWGQAAIVSIANAAIPGSLGSKLPAGGALATAYVTGLSDLQPGIYTAPTNQPLPLNLGGVSVVVNNGSAPARDSRSVRSVAAGPN